jgi:RNA ligase (TIGR02306 family)
MDRRLATVRRISKIIPIEGADNIDLAFVDGWQCVVKKGEFLEHELAVYFEIDSWIPTELAPFLTKGKEPREYNGVKGERLRTIKLRGQLSQGLLLPLSIIIEAYDMGIAPMEGEDVTNYLRVEKWERPIPAQLQGQMRGNFPSWIRKTDQERVQNIADKIIWDDFYEVSIKLDGSSMTIYFDGDDWGVCSRNVDLKTDQEGNAFVDTAKSLLDLIPNKHLLNRVAIQGELMGPKIQGNRENFTGYIFFVFGIWDGNDQCYWKPSDVRKFCSLTRLTHVPALAGNLCLYDAGVRSVDDVLSFADGQSIAHPVREGLVFKSSDGSFSFKAISNKFLLSEK